MFLSLGTGRARLVAVASAAVAAVALTAGFSAAGGAAATAAPRHGGAGARLDRAFVIMLENHSLNSVIGDPNAPYLTSLARQFGEARNYYGVTHPSEPNYVAMISGSNWWTNSDNPANRFDHTNLVDELEAAHISWGAYMQALPAGDPLADYWPSASNPLYASKHDPFALFTDIRNDPARLADIKPYTSLAGDLNTTRAPRFVFITPDQCNDMHGGVSTAVPGYPETPCPFNTVNDDPADVALKHNADAFVHGAVTTIMSSRAWTPHSAIFIVADEGDYTGVAANGGWDSPAGCCDSPVLPAGDPDISAAWPGGVYGGGLVPAMVIDPSGPEHYVSSVAYNHYSLLRTIEDAWHLPELGFTSDHAQVPTMNEFLAH
ncbi:MAG TPA: alkaline phosphatase family protein [Streptosporangiaceae bacterium]|nr:alkaline phosphatase family protein [Streptosporangiaceae bacterium]